jgi:LacI family transcriptional regulator
MPPLHKVAFVSPHWTAYVHRLLRGALTFVETKPGALIRDFRVPLGLRTASTPGEAWSQLRAFNPDGVLGHFDEEMLERTLRFLPRPCPVVCTSNVPMRPGVAVVAASFPYVVQLVVRHFRQGGLRSLAMLLLEKEPQIRSTQVEMFLEVARPANPARATFTEIVAPAMLENPDASVSPVPCRLAAWLRSLPKPTGVYCPQTGGGGYLIRCCNALRLRVPQDVAVIGVDDTDLSLASSPALTSVVPVGEEVGFEAMRVLETMMAGQPGPKDRVRLDAADLHVRQSTALVGAEVCDIAAAVDYIHQHACRGLSVAEVLKATQHVSSVTFHQHFKAATGIGPGEAIRRQQLAEACRLLAETELPVTLVAERTGFGSSNDFARRFRAVEGRSPTEYRRRAHGRQRARLERRPGRMVHRAGKPK